MIEVPVDDNAVDMNVSNSESIANSISVLNTEEKIPILDDDDDVIVLPQEEPVVTEIADDEEAPTLASDPTTIETISPSSELDTDKKEQTTSEQPENDDGEGKCHSAKCSIVSLADLLIAHYPFSRSS